MGGALDTDVEIETPEHIMFRYRLAGPGRRALAYVIDLLVCYGALVVIGMIVIFAIIGVTSAQAEDAMKASAGLLLVLLFAAQWLYFLLWEGLTGRSPGKSALGLRVVTIAGRPIGLRASALRNLLRAADVLPNVYLVGLVSMTLSSKFQRLGDLVAGTMVVVRETARAATALELKPDATPKELAILPDEIALDHEERAAIELFLRRRWTLGRHREHELATLVALPLSQRLGIRLKEGQTPDPARLLALIYDRAINAGRSEAPSSSWRPGLGPKAKRKEVAAWQSPPR